MDSRKTTRAVVISDLHLGGEMPFMMSNPERLGNFLRELPARIKLADDEKLELIINGDFVDFLATPPASPWTPDPSQARLKLQTVINGPFKAVFDGLRAYVNAGHLLTILIGNHDVELFLPGCERLLLETIGGDARQVHLHSDGSAYRIGGALIEHGNRYDDANVVDLDGLRETRSAQSRGEAPPRELVVGEGSKLVVSVVNQLKASGYPFVDLLQPGGELLALLLVALEPTRAFDLPRAYSGWRAGRLADRNKRGEQPRQPRNIAGAGDGTDRELAELFGEAYEALDPRRPTPVSAQALFALPQLAAGDGLASIIRDEKGKNEPLPAKQIGKLQATLRRLLEGDRSLALDGPTGPCGAAAERLSALRDVDVVLMGHTHQARFNAADPKYINTGTWADLIRVPGDALKDSAEGRAALEQFLRCLVLDQDVRQPQPYYADLRIGENGRVQRAVLEPA